MLTFPSHIRVYRQKSCHNPRIDLDPSFYLREHAVIESGGRNNSAYHFEGINTFQSQFERIPSHIILKYKISLCLEDFRFHHILLLRFGTALRPVNDPVARSHW